MGRVHQDSQRRKNLRLAEVAIRRNMAIDCIRVLTNVTAPLFQDAHVHFVKYVIIVLQKNVCMDFKTGCTIIPCPTRRLMWLWKPERRSASRSLSTDHHSLRGHRAHNA